MKKMLKVKRNTPKVLLQVIVELLTAFKYAFIEELGKIATVIQIGVPVILLYRGLDIKEMFIAMVLLAVITKYIREVGYKLNNVSERGIPISPHRYTKVDDAGFVTVKDEDMQEAILYLCDIENYLTSKGLTGK